MLILSNVARAFRNKYWTCTSKFKNVQCKSSKTKCKQCTTAQLATGDYVQIVLFHPLSALSPSLSKQHQLLLLNFFRRCWRQYVAQNFEVHAQSQIGLTDNGVKQIVNWFFHKPDHQLTSFTFPPAVSNKAKNLFVRKHIWHCHGF